MIRNIVLAGVGGQGLITMGMIAGRSLMDEGYKVSIAEVHGLSQRGGSVVIHLRFGDEEYISPIIPPGYGDILVSLELIEAVRHIRLLSPEGLLIANDLVLPPPGAERAPTREELARYIEESSIKHAIVDASRIAKRAGSSAATNTVLLGVLACMKLLPVRMETLEKNVRSHFRRSYWGVNLRALKLGAEEGERLVEVCLK